MNNDLSGFSCCKSAPCNWEVKMIFCVMMFLSSISAKGDRDQHLCKIFFFLFALRKKMMETYQSGRDRRDT